MSMEAYFYRNDKTTFMDIIKGFLDLLHFRYTDDWLKINHQQNFNGWNDFIKITERAHI